MPFKKYIKLNTKTGRKNKWNFIQKYIEIVEQLMHFICLLVRTNIMHCPGVTAFLKLRKSYERRNLTVI